MLLSGVPTLFPTQSVTVTRPVEGGTDAHGNATHATESEVVDGVLCVPGATSDLGEDRPDGVTVAYTLFFPKGRAWDLRGASVDLGDGETYRVEGDPVRWPDDAVPGPFSTTVGVSRVEG